ncbi:hypothetical protein BDZ45DRAFT_413792 [Acephala macrosclerotiorum]|nr:hypothetical protein BDZ45DRAFT_413792 [Acephala macrosclerotiorum]
MIQITTVAIRALHMSTSGRLRLSSLVATLITPSGTVTLILLPKQLPTDLRTKQACPLLSLQLAFLLKTRCPLPWHTLRLPLPQLHPPVLAKQPYFCPIRAHSLHQRPHRRQSPPRSQLLSLKLLVILKSGNQKASRRPVRLRENYLRFPPIGQVRKTALKKAPHRVPLPPLVSLA